MSAQMKDDSANAPAWPAGAVNAYTVLGIASTAPFRQIRSAYLALIKVRHPDIAGTTTARPSAVDINQAYWWLSDPTRRLQYDQSLLAMHPVSFRTTPVLASPPPTARSRWGRALGFASLAALALVSVEYVRLTAGLPGPVVARRDPTTPVQRALGEQRPAIVREAGLNFEWIALQSDEDTVARYSSDCWANLAGDGSEGLLDYCLAFDSAARHAFGRVSRYFASAAMLARARVAARHLGPDEPTRARLVRIDTLLARGERQDAATSRYSVNWFPMAPAAIERRITARAKRGAY